MNDPHSPGASLPLSATSTWMERNGRRARLVATALALFLIVSGVLWWVVFVPTIVATHTVGLGDAEAIVMGSGTLEARVSAIIGSKIPGLIVKIDVDQGDLVKAGDTLALLEDNDLKLQVAVAEDEVAAKSAAIDRLQAERRRTEAVLSQARLTRQRQIDAAASGATSAYELDKSAEALAIAEAEVARAHAATIEGEHLMAAATGILAYQRARLNECTIVAPFDALVIRRDHERGDVVAAGSSLMQLVSLDEMWITAWADETEIVRLSEGKPAAVVFRSQPDTDYRGEVVRVGREADRESREIVVDVRVETLPTHWAIGQRAEVYIRVDRHDNVVVIPAEFLLLRSGKAGVMVNDSGTARWRAVTVGLRGRELVEITDGLSVGDVVVSSDPPTGNSLTDGRRIAPK